MGREPRFLVISLGLWLPGLKAHLLQTSCSVRQSPYHCECFHWLPVAKSISTQRKQMVNIITL